MIYAFVFLLVVFVLRVNIMSQAFSNWYLLLCCAVTSFHSWGDEGLSYIKYFNSIKFDNRLTKVKSLSIIMWLFLVAVYVIFLFCLLVWNELGHWFLLLNHFTFCLVGTFYSYRFDMGFAKRLQLSWFPSRHLVSFEKWSFC